MPLDSASLPPLALGGAPALDLAWQHRERPHLAATALGEAVRTAPHLATLARVVVPRMPRRLLASSSLHTAAAASGLVLLDDAIAAQHIAVRTPTHAHAVVVDCDHDEWADLLAELRGHGVPAETWTAPDPWTGRAHVVWWLRDPVCLTERGRAAPRRLLDDVTRLLTVALRGDLAFTGLLTKNPFAPGKAPTRYGAPALPALWEAHQATAPGLRHAVIAPAPALHDLRTLRRALLRWQEATGTPTPGRRRPAAPAPDSLRGRRLFDTARYRVYARWPLDAAEVADVVTAAAAELGSPITPRQAAGMARRMHAWCSRHLAGCPINRGRDRLAGTGLDLRERQAIAGRRTAEQRRTASAEAARAAVARLAAEGQPVTQVAVAKAADLSERTVRRLWPTLPTPALAPPSLPDRRCPSGRAAVAAPGAPKGTPLLESLSPTPSPPSQPAPPCPDVRIGALMTALETVAALAARPGSEPPALPEVPADLLGHREIRRLRRLVEDAVRDAKRRAAQRAARDEAAVRRADMVRRLTESSSAAWAWWRAEVRRLDDEWDLLELDAADDPGRLDAVRARREAVMRARWSQWQAAQRQVSPPPDKAGIRNTPDSLDLLIPW